MFRNDGERKASKRILRVGAAIVAVLSLVAVDCAQAAGGIRILLLGNSFTAGVKPRLRSLVRSAGRDATVVARSPGRWTLADHLASRATTRKIAAKDWDYVVLQEQSLGMFETRYASARGLDDEIVARGARTVFFMTWRDCDAPLNTYESLRGVPGGSVGYVPIAFELGAPVAPVGWVFRQESIEETAQGLWAGDCHHAADRGRYLAALTLYTTIFGESPVGLWGPPRMTPDQILQDQLLVEEVTLGAAADWNMLP